MDVLQVKCWGGGGGYIHKTISITHIHSVSDIVTNERTCDMDLSFKTPWPWQFTACNPGDQWKIPNEKKQTNNSGISTRSGQNN